MSRGKITSVRFQLSGVSHDFLQFGRHPWTKYQGHGTKCLRRYLWLFPAISVCDLELDLVILTLTFQGQMVANIFEFHNTIYNDMQKCILCGDIVEKGQGHGPKWPLGGLRGVFDHFQPFSHFCPWPWTWTCDFDLEPSRSRGYKLKVIPNKHSYKLQVTRTCLICII